MSKRGPSCAVLRDVISSLPENVLSQIMECLPLRDAARASVLSKTWRYTWLSLPTLTFDAKFFKHVWLNRPQNLVSLSITLDELGENCPISKFQKLIQLLSELSELEKLSIGGYTCKALTSGGIVSLLPFKYKCLKVLQLSYIDGNDFSEFRCVTGIIRSCPVIEVLKISFSSILPVIVLAAEHEIDNAVSCSIDRLREVEVAGVQGFSMELKLIGFLLNHSLALHLFKIKPSVTMDANLESQMTRQLMRFPRASPRAEIIYVDQKASS